MQVMDAHGATRSEVFPTEPALRAEWLQLLADPFVLPRVRVDPEDVVSITHTPESVWALVDECRLPLIQGSFSTDEVLLGYLPAALMLGQCLVPWVSVRSAHTSVGNACVEALHTCRGGDAAGQHVGVLYRSHLAARGLVAPSYEPEDVGRDKRICAADLALGLTLLGMGQRVEGASRAKAIGVHAWMSRHAFPACVREAWGEMWPQTVFDSIRASTERLVARWTEESPCDWLQLQRGVALAHRAHARWLEDLGARMPRTPWAAMHALVTRKAPFALRFHANVKLEGRSLDAWLSQPREIDALLRALAQSRWIVRGEPEKSLFLKHLIAFGGPMFGVFTQDEVEVVTAWIRSLSSVNEVIQATQTRVDETAEELKNKTPNRFPKTSIRSLYTAWQRPEASNNVRSHMRAYLDQELARVDPRRHEQWLQSQQLEEYSQEAFRRWLMRQWELQTTPSDVMHKVAPRLERDEVLWALLQLAPAALVDGAWAQGALQSHALSHDVFHPLAKIYRDELGSGEVEQHHGNVFRATLERHGVVLDTCDSAGFAHDQRISQEAFALPVLWLALAQWSEALVPELLGLNLAVELAGVGTTYGHAIALLKHHRIDPYFFVLHNTIDNLESGHSAWSVQAIASWMTRHPSVHDTMWRRIWKGYALYEITNGPLIRAVAMRLGPKVAWRWVRHALGRG